MSRTKSLLRNAQRIGDSKTPDINQEPTQDLLQKLKDYRSSSKYTSPQKALSKHITTPLPNKHNSSYQKISSRSSRPCTSPYPENLANSNKPLENPGHRANKHSHDLYYQDRSNDRLYRGARVLIGKTTQENLTARGNYKDLSHFFTSEEKAEFEEFLDSIQLLYPLRFDLELNFELVRGEVTSLQHTMAGDYYSLKEKIEGLLKEQEETMKAITSSEIVKLFQEHNRIVRHVLLGLKLKGDGNEATIVEMLWRIIVKLFDNALVVHERGINEMAEMAKIKSRNILKEYSEKLKFLGEANESTKEDYEKRIEKYQEQIKLLQVTLQAKEKAIALKDEKMADLLEIGNRDKSCIEMSRVLKKLNTYIGETEDQQYKQVAALSDIEYVMKMAETFDSKQECASKLTQTDWSIPDSRFPEFIYPKVSGNYFYPLYRPCPDIDFNVVIRNLKRALDECDGEQQFYKQYGEYLIKNYNRQDTEDHLVATAWCLLQNKSVQTSFFSVLLRFQVPISMQFELGLLKINQILISIDNKSAEGYLPLNKTIEALQSAMPSNKDQIERLISSLAFHVSGQIDLKVSLWVLICRFYFALEKTKKPLKFHLEQLDTKKENISNFLNSSKLCYDRMDEK